MELSYRRLPLIGPCYRLIFSGVPQTLATFVSTCSVTSLDWLPNSDRHFVYGTSNGAIRLCDADERKVVTETSTNKGGGSSSSSIQQVSVLVY